MKIKVVFSILMICLGLKVFSIGENQFFQPKFENVLPGQPVINNLDSIIFDLANATVTATYIDLPIYLKSDDVIFGIDYAMQFNMSLLTFSTTIDLIPTDQSIVSLAYFNTNDLFLRYTSTTLQNFPANGSVQVTKIRFGLSAPCVPITAADFMNITVYLNGIVCSSRVTDLDFTQFYPTVDFESGPTCLDAIINFSDSSSVSNGSITAWAWNFSNGAVSTLQNPSITYTASGSASATLMVTTAMGCKDTLVKTLNINILPVSSFSYSFDCVKDSAFFFNSSTITSGSIDGSLWSFGDATGTSTLTSPSYHYNASGVYIASLTSVSNFSCTYTSTLTVDLTNKVNANFTTTAIRNCIGSQINFNDASSYALGTISAWFWEFGDANGANSSQQNPAYTFTTSGTFSVTLTSTSNDGCKGFVTKNVIIDPPPQIQFSTNSSTTCAVDTVRFTDLSTTTNGSSYFWVFGDGSTSNIKNPIHAFTTFGLYHVMLIVTTPGGCGDTLSKPYSVSFPPPSEAVFTSSILANALISFSNLTQYAEKAVWDFGDNQSSILNNPKHAFPNIGTYNVCLTTYDSLDCVSTLCKDIYVGLSKVVAVPSCFTPNFDNNNDVLLVRGGPVVNMNFLIYNEWGNLLFTSNAQELGWDGTFNGEAQPVGIYKYILTGKTLDEKSVNMYGVVNLTR